MRRSHGGDPGRDAPQQASSAAPGPSTIVTISRIRPGGPQVLLDGGRDRRVCAPRIGVLHAQFPRAGGRRRRPPTATARRGRARAQARAIDRGLVTVGGARRAEPLARPRRDVPFALHAGASPRCTGDTVQDNYRVTSPPRRSLGSTVLGVDHGGPAREICEVVSVTAVPIVRVIVNHPGEHCSELITCRELGR